MIINSYDNIFNFKALFLDPYNGVHFDAWANTVAVFNYVQDKGHTYGEQLLSSILFWVPRGIWEGKSFASGMLLGDYLMENHGFWMNNISCSLIAEAYLDFSYPGIIIFGILLARISLWIDSNILYKSTPIALASIYFAFNTIFLFRGPLLSSLAYITGNCLGIYLISMICKKKIIS
tara:strand:+ start:98 stop:628 length:531 start_codon:yes stop_codon:yes gene_type:complete